MTELFGAVLQVLPLIGLIAARVGIAFAALPAPFGATAPMQIRALLGILVAVMVSLPHLDAAAAVDDRPFALLRSAFGELMIGALLGLTVRVVLVAADVAGTVAGFTMGLGFANAVDPTLGEQGMVTAAIFRAFAGLVFFALEGHHALITALGASVQLVPPGQALSVVNADNVLATGSSMVGHGLRIAAPVVATMFITQLAIALVSRAAPKVQLFTFTFALAAAMGLLTLFLSASSVANAIAVEVRTIPVVLMRALQGEHG
ncbi:MAG: flagellar biosynthetic protein FliR [Proteobacteria bacterium]|nr:flagellar biosynthetic protein FliR [Pseudomonadota bacterium]